MREKLEQQRMEMQSVQLSHHDLQRQLHNCPEALREQVQCQLTRVSVPINSGPYLAQLSASYLHSLLFNCLASSHSAWLYVCNMCCIVHCACFLLLVPAHPLYTFLYSADSGSHCFQFICMCIFQVITLYPI